MVVCIDNALTYKCILNLLGLSLTELKPVLIAGTFNPGFGSRGATVCFHLVLLKEQEHAVPELMVISDTGNNVIQQKPRVLGNKMNALNPSHLCPPISMSNF